MTCPGCPPAGLVRLLDLAVQRLRQGQGSFLVDPLRMESSQRVARRRRVSPIRVFSTIDLVPKSSGEREGHLACPICVASRGRSVVYFRDRAGTPSPRRVAMGECSRGRPTPAGERRPTCTEAVSATAHRRSVRPRLAGQKGIQIRRSTLCHLRCRQPLPADKEGYRDRSRVGKCLPI